MELELGTAIFVVFSILLDFLPLFVICVMISLVAKAAKGESGIKGDTGISLNDKRSIIDLQFSESDNAFHEGCRSVGNILHPEKTGFIKNKDNPFEH